MYTIENDSLRVTIKSKGAELDSIYNKQTGLEYMWNADAAFWAKKSPVLFPIVGELKNQTYYYENNAYSLSRHGFAREMEFVVTNKTSDSVTLSLSTNEDTLTKFPFNFVFSLVYKVTDNRLSVMYVIKNTGNKQLYFSVGGHPAFKVPVTSDTTYSDYYLKFDQNETTGRWPISKDGLIEKSPTPLLDNSDKIKLSKELFYKDAIVLKHLQSGKISLLNEKNRNGLEFDFHEFPFLGIWAAKNADFVCIEPWCGIADSVDSDQQLVHKEGINRLDPDTDFERTWSVKVF
ncbi:MAG: aldose 1-epimerase family protein [Chitinophagaceae bacterium]